jgi:transposase-like protein
MGRASGRTRGEDQARLLEDLLIVQLAMAGVPQRRIRKIVGCDMNRVTAIARHVRPAVTTRKQGRKKDGKERE